MSAFGAFSRSRSDSQWRRFLPLTLADFAGSITCFLTTDGARAGSRHKPSQSLRSQIWHRWCRANARDHGLPRVVVKVVVLSPLYSVHPGPRMHSRPVLCFACEESKKTKKCKGGKHEI